VPRDAPTVRGSGSGLFPVKKSLPLIDPLHSCKLKSSGGLVADDLLDQVQQTTQKTWTPVLRAIQNYLVRCALSSYPVGLLYASKCFAHSKEGSLVQVKNVSQIAGLSEKRLIQEYLQAWENRLDGTINNTPYETAKWGLVIPGGKTEERVVEVLQNKEGLVEQRWRERYEKTKARLMLSGLDTTKIEQKYLIWMRVRLAGERPIDVARDYGYADGSGIVQCIKRIEKKALNDQELKQYLLSLSLALKKPERTKPITLNEDFRGAEPLPVVLL